MSWLRGKKGEPKTLSQAIQIVKRGVQQLGGGGKIEWEETEGEAICQFSLSPGEVRVSLTSPGEDRSGALLVVGSLMQIPEGSALPLYRRLLDLNASDLFGVAFGLRKSLVVVTTECTWDELTETRAAELIRQICGVIEDHTNELAGEFGCVRICDLRNRAA